MKLTGLYSNKKKIQKILQNLLYLCYVTIYMSQLVK